MSAYTEKKITFVVHTSADKAFPLFSARREMEWDSDWRPIFLADDHIFLVNNELGKSIWVMTRYDANARVINYVRVTPDHTVAEITIEITPTGARESRATVTYRVTGVSEAGNEFVARFAEDFPTKGPIWAQVINHYIATGRPLGTPYDVSA